MPKISLIIPTYDRDNVLPDTINYALNQKFTDYEILVIDQNKRHSSKFYNFLDTLPPIVRIIKHFPPSLPGARNRAIKEAKSPIIIFIDDDVIIQDDFVQEHYKYHHNPEIGCVTGRVEQHPRYNTKMPFFIKSEFLQWFSIGKYQEEKREIAYRAAGGNMSFKKKVALQSGLYDENFIGTAWGEEYDFSIRLKKSGYKIFYNPRASIYHLNTPTGGVNNRSRYDAKTVYSRGHNLSYLIEKNKLSRCYYLFLILYVYKQLFIKKDYVSMKGFLFILTGSFFFIKGFFQGYKKGSEM